MTVRVMGHRKLDILLIHVVLGGMMYGYTRPNDTVTYPVAEVKQYEFLT